MKIETRNIDKKKIINISKISKGSKRILLTSFASNKLTIKFKIIIVQTIISPDIILVM